MPEITEQSEVEWLSPGEASSLLGGVSTKQLGRLADEGQVRARRIGARGMRRYERLSVEALAKAGDNA